MVNHNDTDWEGEVDQGPDENDADLMDDERIELIKCTSCGEMISEFAQQCPYCKDWIVASGSPGMLHGRPWWWIALALLGIGMFILYFAI